MKKQKLFAQIRLHFKEVVDQSTDIGKKLREKLENLHSADAAYFFSLLDYDESKNLFLCLSSKKRLKIFKELSDSRKAIYLSFLDVESLHDFLAKLSVDELTEFFDELSDDELKSYLKLLQEKECEQVLSVLKLEKDSVGRHMEMDVLTLVKEFTVGQSIQLLQRLQPDQELHRRIYVTSAKNKLVGYILLEDLVLKKSDTKLATIVRTPEFEAIVGEDQESIAHKMMHYHVTNAPVIDTKKRFLGVISANALMDIMEEESSEDIFRMATMRPIYKSYFETSFFRLLYQRSSILIVLLFAQTLSTIILRRYEVVLAGFLTYFITMLVSTGGNASSQTSALVIQGLASGEIHNENMYKFVWREIRMSIVIGAILLLVSFARVYWVYSNFWGSFAVSLSLGTTVILSIVLGSCIPIILKKIKLDPAHSAGPLLATLMDIVGLFIYCTISQYILS